MAGRHGGKFGVVNGRSAIQNWSINHTSFPAVTKPSNLRNGTMRRKGVQDWNGSFTQVHGKPDLFPGESFTFQGYTSSDTDVYDTNGEVYSGTAFIDSMNMVWSWANGTPAILTTFNFSGSGALTSSNTKYTDTSTEMTPSICDLKIEQADVDVFSAIANVTNITWNVTAENVGRANSSTSCWVERKAGNIDWTLAVTEEETDQLLAIGDNFQLKLYVNATEFWLLKWGHLESYTDLTVDVESGDIISKVINFSMEGHDGTTGVGTIKDPDDTAQWP